MPSPMKFVGGLPCLDFVNTVGGWRRGRVFEDKLESYLDLIRWASLAGIAVTPPARSNPRDAAQVLERARAIRLGLYRLLNSLLEKRTPAPADLALFRAELAIARNHQTLIIQDGRLAWAFDDTYALDAVLWRVSQSAADLLTSPDLDRVRLCAGETCGWLFLDTTRNHSRHWCDMKDCGNRAKVRRFRKRQTVQ
jgi:predicted RNA-binding Zn ribbon-like protein